MTPVELSRTVLRAVRRAVDEGELRVSVPERVVVTVPGPGGCGDYATNVALQLARPAGQPPLRVAEILRPHLADVDGVTDVVVTGPGFLNISLGSAAPAEVVADILRAGTEYGHRDADAQGGPNAKGGPDEYGHEPRTDLVSLSCPPEVRAVVVTDVVARILRSQGAAVRAWCDGEIAPQWGAVLGVRLDGRPEQGEGAAPQPPGSASSPHYSVRPVPAPADPLPLGRDAARWALLHPAGHDRPRIDDEHLVQRESNPLFRVRYAHARTRALSRNAADLGFDAEPGDVRLNLDLNIDLAPRDVRHHPHPHARRPQHATPHHPLIPLLADHPRTLTQAAAHRAPDRLARHLVSVADAVLPLLPAVLPRGAEKPSAAHRARLALAEAAGTVLAGGLSLLGIDAPDHL
ncbi:ArgS-related anticodon-binding protein NrtL [Streptomyces sp. NPDC098781]|uniref:ArgS-related anticodon-binding protein NrtL n=1 Tax=Streptomyces sp. NPDC098781 TaxID=3366097 RepID=UPI00380C01A7